ncbi:hypothetical protein GCM10007390_14960 [Persicitalea jodogahamensis]|uniref:histidine kinase n=2 Tax=Persicitalea jodogahamensis TaxID=402147 RepID=A0A8J3D7D5_9BACT|nr:hypothetical protein GCM10007390_14960 [Persicitalea jodogahamensis]
MIQLERLFNLDAAIHVGEEMARLAKKHKNSGREAAAYTDLSRYYDALGAYKLAAMYLEKALTVYQTLGDESSMLSVEFALLKFQLHFVRREKVIPGMEALLTKALAVKSQRLSQKLQMQLLEQYLLAGNIRKAEAYLPSLNNLPESNPIRPEEYPLLINASKLKGDLALAKSDLAQAERHYLKTLQYSQAEPGPWMEIHTLLDLSSLKLLQGQVVQAKDYLEDALGKAERLQLDELLTRTYTLKSKIAEQENNPADALRFLKKKIFHEEKFSAQSAGFNIENFYLQAERDKLAANEKNRGLELNLKKSQLTYSLVILVLVALLAVGLVMGYIRQRRGKVELADKNRLIQLHANQLESLDLAKSRFFANISHELRTPLTLIAGPIATLMRENQLSEKHTTLLKIANRSVRQLESMVKEILDLRKLEMGKMPLDLEATRLKAFFEVHLDQFQSLGQWKKIHYSHEVRVPSGTVADLDQEKCRQVLYNLLSNAFKFTPANGKVRVEVELQGEELLLRVKDTGPGIAPDDLPHIFDHFFQTSQKDRSLAGGTGIGLALCHEYTRLMNGAIRVESKPDEGTVFFISWPVDVSSKQPSTPVPLYVPPVEAGCEGHASLGEPVIEPYPTDPATGPRPTILVVEDNPGLREYIGLILSEKYLVLFAEHGAAALEKIKHGKPAIDLILSDLMMPVMDGYQLLERLKSGDATRHIPVIMLTARVELADRLHALRIGVDDYLTKPFDEEELVVRIENLLKNQSTRRQEVFVENKEIGDEFQLAEADQKWLENFETYIRTNLESGLLDIPSLSETFAMSESTLLRQLKRLTGLSPSKYLQEIRLNEARLLLESGTPVSVAVLASRVGYKNAGSFARSFKKRFGKLPSDFA